jgi:predicted HTH domain antitoxin
MGTVSARLPDELEDELDEYVEEEGLERSVAVRKLLSEGLDEWKRERALSLLEDGEVSFSRAAEMSGTDIWSFAEYVEDEGVVWVEDTEEDLEAV